ncbi:MAG: DedD protein [Planctomycetota bacterium]|jgi:DedD protein
MDQNTKNRLVGIVVIFSLAVIFLPMILDGAGVQKDKLEVVIPSQTIVGENPEFEHKVIELRAQVEAIPLLKPKIVDEHSPDVNLRPTPVEKFNEVDSKNLNDGISADEKPVAAGGISWVLQVGSFLDRKKALIQRDQLRKSNIAAVFIEQFDANNKINYRVRLGPFVSRERTKVAQNKIKAKHNIDGIIMKYER